LAYSARTWTEGVTALGPTELNQIEQALTHMPYGLDPSGSGYVPVSDGANGWTMARPTGYELAYTEFTSNVSVTNTIGDVVDSGSLSYDGTTVNVEFFCPAFTGPASSAGEVQIHLYDSTTDLGILARFGFTVWGSGNITPEFPVIAKRRLTPSAATHDYKIRAVMTSAVTGTLVAGAGGVGANMPGYVRITKA
jgi:hypothetical protein